MSRFVTPENRTLKLSNGDSIVVKRRLNRGETAEMFAHMRPSDPADPRNLDSAKVGLATVLAYLLDWSLTDDDGQKVPVRDLSWDEREMVVNGLDPEDFAEIRRAVDAHVDAVQAERDAEKKPKGGETASSATSSSHDITAGPTTTSEPSTLTSTT